MRIFEMKNELISEVRSLWKRVGHHKTPEEIDVQLAINNRLLNIFQVGNYYFFTFIPPTCEITQISPLIENVLGYRKEYIDINFIISIIHPDDLLTFIEFERRVVEFKFNLPPEKLLKYKSQYNYRIRKKNGVYIPILQQSITVQCDEEGAVLKNLVVHTDISTITSDTNMSLSFIGLDGEKSYINESSNKSFVPLKLGLTQRELQVLNLLSQNLTTNEIAETLSISPHTVSTHRKNIHAKTGTHNLLELLQKATKDRWI